MRVTAVCVHPSVLFVLPFVCRHQSVHGDFSRFGPPLCFFRRTFRRVTAVVVKKGERDAGIALFFVLGDGLRHDNIARQLSRRLYHRSPVICVSSVSINVCRVYKKKVTRVNELRTNYKLC